jgi:diguanylate cyclase (GGDEF)-like protein/PAS domain S-box-containing protein
MSFARDITNELSETQQRLAASPLVDITAEHYKAIVASSDDAIISKTLDGIVTSWNQGAQLIFGYSALEMLGRSLLVLFPKDRINEEQYFIEQLMAGRKVDHFETVRIHKDGHLVEVSVTLSPICDGNGKVIGASKIARDITPLKLEKQRLQLALDATNQGLWDWNLKTGYVYRSAHYYETVGLNANEDTHDLEFFKRTIHPQDMELALQSIDAYRRGLSNSIEFECRLADTERLKGHWMQVRGQAVERDHDGLPVRIVGTVTDITNKKELDATLREHELQLVRVIEGSDQGYWDWNVQTDSLVVSARWETMLGYQPGEMDVAAGHYIHYIHPDDADRVMALAKSHLAGEIENLDSEIRLRTKSGAWCWIQTRGRIVARDAQGKALMMSGTHTDISQRKAHESELDRVAHFDPLTGAPNRRLLADRLEQSIARANRNGKSLAVCYLDLDGFKVVNDRYGHACGDQLLIGVTESLKSVLRSEDTLARLGGDEFVLLLSDIGTPEECSVILDRVLHAIRLPVVADGITVSASASIGVSLFPQDHADADTLLRHADQAMYRAKEAGKNRFHLFDPDSDRKAQIHRQFVDRLHLALQHQEFRLYFQPKVDLRTGEIVGAEALIRWQHPEQGLLSPAAFLPHVEGSSVDHPLGVWVINTALQQTARWLEQGHVVKVSVNIGANHLLRPGFLDDLRDALAHQPNIAASLLELEVLESAALNDMDQAVAVLNQCHALGVGLALDDFGTGYSSLTYLRKLPVDVLKIDQSFVRDMLKDPEDFGIVECVVSLAEAFHRDVIAEGVETMEHGAALLKLGCHLVQGYGIARPMPAELFLDWARTWREKSPWQHIAH